MSQEGQKDHQRQQPPEPLPVRRAIIQKVRAVQVHQSRDRETEKQILKAIRLLTFLAVVKPLDNIPLKRQCAKFKNIF
jgi:hypothetical protein